MTKYLPFLDTLRALSVLIVIGRHFGVSEYFPGGFGVTIFFFISGFLITTLLVDEEKRNGSIDVRSFYMRRIWRLIPPLLLLLFLIVPAYLLLQHQALSGSQVAFAALYTANFHNIAVDYLGWNEGIKSFRILWSLAVEEHFYLVFPLVLLAVHSNSARLRVVIFGCVIALLLRVFAWLIFDSASSFNYHFTLTRMDSILYGVMFGLLHSQHKNSYQIDCISSVGILLVGLLLLFFSLLYRDEFFQAVIKFSIQGVGLFFIFAILFFENPVRSFVQRFDFGVTRFLGGISYEMYLWHFPIYHLTSYWFTGLVNKGIALVGTIFFSWCAFRLVGLMVLKLKRMQLTKRMS